MNFTEKLSDLWVKYQFVNQKESKGFLSQLLDIMYLYRVNPSCSVFDYYRFKLYSYERQSAQYANTLGTGTMESVNRALNKRVAVTPAWDKLLYALCCKTYGIATAETIAVFKERGNLPNTFRYKLASPQDIKAFFMEYQQPVYVKPALSQQGNGGYWVERYDSQTDHIVLKGGATLTFADFIQKTINSDYRYYNKDAGYLFQKPIKQHQSMINFTGTEAPSGLRIVVLNTNDGPKVHRVVWKVVSNGNNNDNFRKGVLGNLLVEVDLKSGALSDAVSGYWPYAKTYDRHPVSGNKFSEFTIPFWPEIMEQAIFASNALSCMYILHWDVIVTDAGPLFLELNDLGSSEILQLHGTPYVDDTLRDHLRNKGNLVGHKALQKMLM